MYNYNGSFTITNKAFYNGLNDTNSVEYNTLAKNISEMVCCCKLQNAYHTSVNWNPGPPTTVEERVINTFNRGFSAFLTTSIHGGIIKN